MIIGDRLADSRAEGLDDEDLALRLALDSMQDIVSRHLAEAGKDAQSFSTDELCSFIAKVNPYLKFEFQQSDAIWKPMPIEAQGEGAFLLVDHDTGDVVGIDPLHRNERISGMIESVQTLAVPTTRWIHQHLDDPGSKHLDDKTMSAIVVLEGSHYYGRAADYDFSEYHVLLPVVYGMPTSLADIAA